MRELLATLDGWAADDAEVGVATVVRTAGSTPRSAGARLLTSRDGRIEGSVSGGCLEAAVIEELRSTLRGTAPPRMLEYGISDELGWEVGLACGGTVGIFVETQRWDGSDPVLQRLRTALEARRPAAFLTVVEGEGTGRRAVFDGADGNELTGSLGSPEIDAEALSLARHRLASGLPGVEDVAGVRLFVEPHVPQPHLAIVGAVHIGAVLCALAQQVGYRVSVVDPRAAFLTAERFPTAEAMVARWPNVALPELGLGERDAAVCLSHDTKFEDPALSALLATPVGYIGAIGSRTTHGRRVERLRRAGFDDSAIGRVHSPVGLDLGAATPEEIALAICAEMVAVRRGHTGASLTEAAAASRASS